MKTIIKNFTGIDSVEIEPHKGDHGETVTIIQHAGSMNFQIDLTAIGARLMASALIAAANEITSNSGDMLDSDEFAELGRVMDKDND